MPAKIEFKGIRDGLLVTLSEGQWAALQQSLLAHIDQQGEFLKGARLTIDVGNQILKAVEVGRLRDSLAERGISLWAILSDSPTTEQTAQSFGLATRLPQPTPDRPTRPLGAPLPGDEAVLAQRTLRSGHTIKYPGHVVVIGDVNPGAEIIAGGNVVVWGRLRGTVHAGAQGDESAVICALELSPTQLRIADTVSIAPPDKERPQPETARLIDGQIVAERWIFKGR